MSRPGARATIRITDGILQDTLKQRWKFFRRPITVFFRETHHAVLHDIERCFLVTHGEYGLLEGASLDTGEKIGKLDT